jgi:hypothetical protein
MAFWALSRAGTFSTRPVAFLFCSFIMQRRLFHHNDTTVCILVRLHFWQKEVYSMAGKPAGDRVGFYFFSSAGRSGVCRKGEGKPKSVDNGGWGFQGTLSVQRRACLASLAVTEQTKNFKSQQKDSQNNPKRLFNFWCRA